MNKKRRQINISEEDYLRIKEYCDINAYDLPKWVVKTLTIIISNNEKCPDCGQKPYERGTPILSKKLLKG